MKLHVLSDLHLEQGDLVLPKVKSDVLVLAGDIGEGVRGFEWALRESEGRPTIYVPGNHELYDQDWSLEDLDYELARRSADGNVHYCPEPGRRIDLGDVRFLCARLWTDYQLRNMQVQDMIWARTMMNDGQIQVASTSPYASRFGRFTPGIALALHEASVRFLESELAKPWTGRTVLVTHHAPTGKSVEPMWDWQARKSAYASNLLERFQREGFQIDLAIHGHVHQAQDFQIGSTHVVVNPRGYEPGFPCRGFDAGKVIEL